MEHFAKISRNTLLSQNKVAKGIKYALKECALFVLNLILPFKWLSKYTSTSAPGTCVHCQKPQYFV